VNEEAVRQIVREVLARRQAALQPRGAHGIQASQPPAGEHRVDRWRLHVSHGRLSPGGGDAEGRCLVEPAVRCSHCGYCQSYGH
jgi:hypothetical protein